MTMSAQESPKMCLQLIMYKIHYCKQFCTYFLAKYYQATLIAQLGFSNTEQE